MKSTRRNPGRTAPRISSTGTGCKTPTSRTRWMESRPGLCSGPGFSCFRSPGMKPCRRSSAVPGETVRRSLCGPGRAVRRSLRGSGRAVRQNLRGPASTFHGPPTCWLPGLPREVPVTAARPSRERVGTPMQFFLTKNASSRRQIHDIFVPLYQSVSTI